MNQEATHTITVHNVSYPAFIDPRGEIRFVANPIFRDLMREAQQAYSQHVKVEGNPSSSYTKMSVAKIHTLVDQGVYTEQDLLDFYIRIGYSIKYLKRLPEFEHVEFITHENKDGKTH